MALAISLAVNIIVVSALFLFLTRRLVRRLSQEESLEQLQREAGAIVTEMNQAAERNISLLEDRIDQLKKIEERVDRKITLFNRESEKETQSATTYREIVREAQQRIRDDATASKKSADNQNQAPPPLRERILDLHRKGISANIIATRVGSTVGEVELVIGLS
ncbi:MAG: hypothetical protein MJA84_15715, partial [Firmicutes bacterium]|nr:hypothetical protein [Bacillota bacterium]